MVCRNRRASRETARGNHCRGIFLCIVAGPRRSALDWILEVVSLAVLLAIFGAVGLNWKNLPARVPRHFNASGNPDGWGGKNGLLLLPLTSLGIYVLLTVASRYQKLINIPMAIDRDAPEVRSLLLGMSTLLKTILLFVFLYLTWANVNTAMGLAGGLGKPFLPVSVAVVFTTLGLYMFKLRRYRR